MWPRLIRISLYAGLTALLFITFAPSVGNDFVDWDDYAFVVDNRNIRSIDTDSLYWMLTTGYQGAWHPLTWFSHALDRALFGLNPSPHHLVSIIIHIINCLLVFFLFLKLIEVWQEDQASEDHGFDQAKYFAAFFTALLFGIHPLRVESVVWISERKDVLFAGFYLAGLICYLGYGRKRAVKPAQNYAATLFFFVLSILSKSMAITFPLAILILDYYPLKRDKRIPIIRILREKIPFLIISALGIVIYQFAKGPTGSVPVEYVPVQMRVMNAFYSLFWYIKQTIFPGDLIPLYQLNRDLDYYSGIYLFSAFLVGLVTIVCLWRAYKGERLWASAWFFYLFTIFPALGLYMVFRHSMADRYTYLPTLSFWILFGLALRTLWRNAVQIRWASIAKTALVVSLCVLALAYGMRTRDQITVWGNSSLLWTHVIKKSEYVPALAYFALARVFHKEGELDKALSYFNRAHELNPKNPKYLAGMAAVLVEQKKYEEGLALYKKAARLRPSDAVYQAHLGRTYALMERPKEAEERLLKALEMDESFHSAHMLLAILYKETGRERKARERYILFKRSGGDLGGNIASSLGIASEGEDIVTAE